MKTTSIKDILGEDLFKEYERVMRSTAEVDMCKIHFDEIPACPLEGCHLTIPSDIKPIIDKSLLETVDKLTRQEEPPFSIDECLSSISSKISNVSAKVEKDKGTIRRILELCKDLPLIYACSFIHERSLKDRSKITGLESGIPSKVYDVIKNAHQKGATQIERVEDFSRKLNFESFDKLLTSLDYSLRIFNNCLNSKRKYDSKNAIKIFGKKDGKKLKSRIFHQSYIEHFLIDFCNKFVVFDTELKEKQIVDDLKSVKCVMKSMIGDEGVGVKDQSNTNTNQDADMSLREISRNPKAYDITKPAYWRKFTNFLNIVSVIPTYWTTGIILPPSTPIKLPIIHKFMVVIPAVIIGKIFVIWLTINGVVVFPTMLEIDLNRKVSSTWRILFRGGSVKIKDNGGSIVINTNLKTETENGGSAIVDTDPSSFQSLAVQSDDFPPFERMGMNNLQFIAFLNEMMRKQTPYMGFPA